MNIRQLDKISKKCDKLIGNILDIVFIVNDEIFKFEGDQMDKKMHKVTEKMKVAEKDLKKGESKAAEKVLKKAEKKNEKLVKIDREVRDPMIAKCKKMMHSKKK